MTQERKRRLIGALGGVVLLTLIGWGLGRVVAGSTAQLLVPDDYLPVVARAEPTATPTPSPTPVLTPTRNPGIDYRNDFTDQITGWEARRWRDNAIWSIQHGAGCDLNNRCGFLNVEVGPRNAYVLTAPMVASKPISYRIEAMGLFKEGQDKQQWGIVFAADSDASQPCPVADFTSCFNTFYDLRLRYRPPVLEEDPPYLEYRLKYVTSFDEANGPQGPSLKDWTPIDGSDASEWNNLRVELRDGGRIRIFVNDVELIEVIDPDFIDDQAQVGLIVANDEKGDVRVKFDYFATRAR